jgi:hypothetical protein
MEYQQETDSRTALWLGEQEKGLTADGFTLRWRGEYIVRWTKCEGLYRIDAALVLGPQKCKLEVQTKNCLFNLCVVERGSYRQACNGARRSLRRQAATMNGALDLFNGYTDAESDRSWVFFFTPVKGE